MPRFRFKVLRGRHTCNGPNNQDGTPGPNLNYYKGGPHGDIVATDQDLRVHNTPGVQPRYELLTDASEGRPRSDGNYTQPGNPSTFTPRTSGELRIALEEAEKREAAEAAKSQEQEDDTPNNPEGDEFDRMTMKELRAMADEEELEIHGVSSLNKEQLAKAVREGVLAKNQA